MGLFAIGKERQGDRQYGISSSSAYIRSMSLGIGGLAKTGPIVESLLGRIPSAVVQLS